MPYPIAASHALDTIVSCPGTHITTCVPARPVPALAPHVDLPSSFQWLRSSPLASTVLTNGLPTVLANHNVGPLIGHIGVDDIVSATLLLMFSSRDVVGSVASVKVEGKSAGAASMMFPMAMLDCGSPLPNTLVLPLNIGRNVKLGMSPLDLAAALGRVLLAIVVQRLVSKLSDRLSKMKAVKAQRGTYGPQYTKALKEAADAGVRNASDKAIKRAVAKEIIAKSALNSATETIKASQAQGDLVVALRVAASHGAVEGTLGYTYNTSTGRNEAQADLKVDLVDSEQGAWGVESKSKAGWGGEDSQTGVPTTEVSWTNDTAAYAAAKHGSKGKTPAVRAGLTTGVDEKGVVGFEGRLGIDKSATYRAKIEVHTSTGEVFHSHGIDGEAVNLDSMQSDSSLSGEKTTLSDPTGAKQVFSRAKPAGASA